MSGGTAKNPFRPSFGITPQVTAGRDNTLLQVELALTEGPGSPYRFTLISGARGTGKTVLLNMLEATAKGRGWQIIRIPASADMLTQLSLNDLPTLLTKLDPHPTSRKLTGGSIQPLGSITTQNEDKYPVTHTFRSLLKQAAQFAEEQGSGIFLSLDELQSAKIEDLHLLTDSIQDCVRDELPIALTVAGLPAEISELLQHPGTTFLRRSIPVTTDHIPDTDVEHILLKTAEIGDRTFDSEALELATSVISGYAFLTQLVGSISFSMAEGSVITKSNVQRALPLVKDRLGLQVHYPAVKNLPEREKEYLLAMQTHESTGLIAEEMGIPANQQSTYQRRLKDRGLIYSPRMGHIDYAIPFLREYIRRNPTFEYPAAT